MPELHFMDYLASFLTSPSSTFRSGEFFFKIVGLRPKKQTVSTDLSQIKRILVVRVDEIGDVVMTSGFLRELRRLAPQAEITLIVKPAVYNLVERCPYVDHILTFDWIVKNPRIRNLLLHIRALKLFWKFYFKNSFDLALLPRWDADRHYATFAAYLSGASRRIGYSESVTPLKQQLNRSLDLLLTHPLKDASIKHEVEHNMDILQFLGGKIENQALELWLSEEDVQWSRQFLKNKDISPDSLFIVLAPGTRQPRKQWPLERFAELARWLFQEYGAKILAIGASEEKGLGQKLQEKAGPHLINGIGEMTLRQTAAVLKFSRLLIGNDTGPMHLAAALNVPSVVLFCHPADGFKGSSNSPVRFGPWKSDGIVIQPKTAQPPCVEECRSESAHCICGIPVSQVKEALVSGMFSFKKVYTA